MKKTKENKLYVLLQSFDLSNFGFFQKNAVKEMCIFLSKEITLRTLAGSSQSIEKSGYICHICHLKNGLSLCCITDKEYPSSTAMNFLIKTLLVFEKEIDNSKLNTINEDMNISILEIDSLFHTYQDPFKIDKMISIKKELDDITEITTKTFDSIMERGEKMEDLIDRTKDLSESTKDFVREANKLNSCCVLF